MPFPFESLDVYRKATEWIELATAVRRCAKAKVPSALLDQLHRASLSIALNIAEGHGKWRAPDRQSYFRNARGSVYECAAITQALHRAAVLDEPTYRKSYALLQDIGKMLTKLIVATTESRVPSPRS